jgi:hypothetical protein
LCKDLTGQLLGAVDRAVHRMSDLAPAVSFGKPGEPLFGLREGRDTGRDVAPVQGRDTAIVGEDVPNVFIQLAAAEQLYRPQPQPLLEHLRILHVDAARRVATHIGAVDKRPRKAQELAIDKDRAEQIDVVEMHHHPAGRVRVVGDQYVAWFPSRHGARAGMHCNAHQRRRPTAVGIGEHLAFGGDERHPEILGFLDKGRMRRAQHDPRHLVDHRLEEIGEDLDTDGVLSGGRFYRHGYLAVRSSTGAPVAIMCSCQPFGIKLVIAWAGEGFNQRKSAWPSPASRTVRCGG